MFKRNAEIKCYQAVFAFLFLNLLFCNVVRMSFGVRGVRAALSIGFFGVTIRKTFRVLSKTKRKRSDSYTVRTQLSRYERVRITI